MFPGEFIVLTELSNTMEIVNTADKTRKVNSVWLYVFSRYILYEFDSFMVFILILLQ